MVSKLHLATSPGLVRATSLKFESPFVDLKVHGELFGLFDSSHAIMGPHMREGVKGMIFTLNPNSYKLELLGELVV